MSVYRKFMGAIEKLEGFAFPIKFTLMLLAITAVIGLFMGGFF